MQHALAFTAKAGARERGWPEAVLLDACGELCTATDRSSGHHHTSAAAAAVAVCPLPQAGVFRELMGRCTARQMKWLVRIVLKEIKVRAVRFAR